VARRGGLLGTERARSDHAASHDKPPAAAKPLNPAKFTGKCARLARTAGEDSPSPNAQRFCPERRGETSRTVARIGITPASSRKKKDRLPKGRSLGCGRCRHGTKGCSTYCKPTYRQKKCVYLDSQPADSSVLPQEILSKCSKYNSRNQGLNSTQH